jgi:ubiquinone/menaquinone biosynthesis C-methylase UbiE
MTVNNPPRNYALGSTDAEHERLIWQAQRFAPFTERLFREAGIDRGQRVIDIGSGVGDVALLVERIVGPSGKVVGIERDPRSIARARTRVAEAGLHHVEFLQCDISEIPDTQAFDAAVGRFILMWVSDPVSVLRSVWRLVRSGGVAAFHEPYWAPALELLKTLPLWSATANVVYETFRRSGARPELGPDLYRVFLEAGLPEPAMRLEMILGKDPELAQWFCDIVQTLLPQIQEFGLWTEELGDLEALRERLQAEVVTSKTVATWPATVGAWCRKPKEETLTISNTAQGR